MRRRLATAALRALNWPLRSLARLRPAGVIFVLLALLCGALSIGSYEWSNIPLLMSLILLSLCALAMWIGSYSLRGVQLRRSHVERVFANESFSVSLYLRNASAWPSAGLAISEQIENDDAESRAQSEPRASASGNTPRVPIASGGAFITMVPGKGQERARYNLVMRRRGLYRFADTTIETLFPFGFFHSAAARRQPGRLVVYPRLGEIDAAFYQELELSLEFIRRSRPSRAEEDFRGLREYRQGDNPKWIHWRSSARLQTTLVKEFEEPQARRILLLIDTNLLRLGVQRFAAFESALSFAATVTRDLVLRGCEVECAGLQPPNRVARTTVSRERRNLDALLEMLAGFKRDDRRALPHLQDYLGRRSLHRAYVIVLGLGSLRAKVPLHWLQTGDNALKVLDARGEEFQRIFRRAEGPVRDEDDLLLGLGDEENVAEPEAATSAS